LHLRGIGHSESSLEHLHAINTHTQAE
jgi:hypothetical protein